MIELQAKDHRYFWTGWFDGHSLNTLAATFALLSATDLLATIRMIPLGVREANALAHVILDTGGTPGMALYKLSQVVLVLAATWQIARRRPALARAILWGANLLMGVILLQHLAVIAQVAL